MLHSFQNLVGNSAGNLGHGDSEAKTAPHGQPRPESIDAIASSSQVVFLMNDRKGFIHGKTPWYLPSGYD